MKIEDNLSRKLKALRELSLRGEENEKQLAGKKLSLLLEKYNLTMDSISPEKSYFYDFRYRTILERRLLTQIKYKVTDNNNGEYRKVAGKKIAALELTEAQFMEVDYLYSFYKKELAAGLKKYYKAFIQANNIFGDSSGGTSEITDYMLEVMAMASSIKTNTPMKLLNGKDITQ